MSETEASQGREETGLVLGEESGPSLTQADPPTHALPPPRWGGGWFSITAPGSPLVGTQVPT